MNPVVWSILSIAGPITAFLLLFMLFLQDWRLDWITPRVILALTGIGAALGLYAVAVRLFSLTRGLYRTLHSVEGYVSELEQANHTIQAEIETRLKLEADYAWETQHDSLTGLPNRALFLQRVEEVIRMQQEHGRPGNAVLLVDLDGFSRINHSLGHPSGEMIIKKAAQRLLQALNAGETLARLDWDEFAVLINGVVEKEDALARAAVLQDGLKPAIDVDGLPVFLSCSLGIVNRLDTYHEPEAVMRDAGLAMYQAKTNGKDRAVVFHADIREGMVNRLRLESDLRKGLERGEFVLHYQPVLALPEGRVVGFEALVRWNHPALGLLRPGAFIDVAEETGIIVPLGEWVLDEACRQAHRWQVDGLYYHPLKMSVNISARQLAQPNFVEIVEQALIKHHLPGSLLVFEITESICLENMDRTAQLLEQLHGLGVEIQIDDFGTGYSSFRYLLRLPVQTIKIDKFFVHTLPNDNEQAPAIVRGILSLAGELGIKAIAEGIETECQLAALNQLCCDYGQGFFLAYPMDHEAAARWIEEREKIVV